MKEKVKDILIRAGKTFVQAFIGSLPASVTFAQLTDKAFLISLLIGGLSAGISALMNFVLALLKKEN